jgi:hypothetical protein
MFIGIGMNIVKGGANGIPSTPWFLANGVFDTAGIWWDIVPFPTQWFLESGYFNILGLWEDSRSYP